MIDPCVSEVYGKSLNKLYDDLEEEAQQGKLDLTKYCFPFMPYIGREYGRARRKILYVGKATNGWDDDKNKERCLSDAAKERISAEELVKITNGFMKNSIEEWYGGLCKSNRNSGPGYPCAFFHWIYKLTVSILRNEPQLFSYEGIEKCPNRAEECFSSIAWTNLFKIGGVRNKGKTANPDKPIREFLRNGFMLLKDEISCLKPDLIVFMTRNEYEEYLKQVFPDWKPTITEVNYARIQGVSTNALVIWSCHPQGKPNEVAANLYKFIIQQLGQS